MTARFCLLAALAATLSCVSATTTTCGNSTLCPSDTPCCSSYGQCGVGAYCLGGCDPVHSFDLQSCVAAPLCTTADYKLTSLSDVQANTEYLGNASAANWVSSGIPLEYDNSILLTMAPSTVGTLLSSTHYVWYGKISATLATSGGTGVVTAFILMSDVKDEIDFEFVGVDLTHAQSNFYFQGITDYDNELNLTVSSDTRENLHTYTIDWQPDYITWAVDGTVYRTLNRNTTWSSADNAYHFPQSPARIQLSLWPAGLSTNSEGTIDWAGGLVNWEDTTYMQNGYYFARVTEVTVECYDPPSGYQDHGSAAYYYTSTLGTNNTVATGNNDTILSSFYATGDDPSYCPGGCSVSGSTATATSATASMSSTPETVPGVSGGGNAGNDETTASDTTSSSNSSSTSSSSSGSSFTQGASSVTGSSDASQVVAGSAIALIGFFVAALLL